MDFVVGAIQNGDLSNIMDHMLHMHHHDHLDNQPTITSMGEIQEVDEAPTNVFCRGMGMIM
jgi:hypothetical protein